MSIDRRSFLKASLAATAAIAAAPGLTIAAAKSKPNIIVILADDLGYGDVGCYGATAVKTPNIDRIANEGLRFTSGYCSASTCTPFITRWPGTIKPGVTDEMVCTIDLPASLAAFVDQPLGEAECPDSFNVLSALLGKVDAKGRDHLVQQGNNGRKLALRSGNWKLVGQNELYNLSEDPGEARNIIKTQPERAEELKVQLAEIKARGRSRP